MRLEDQHALGGAGHFVPQVIGRWWDGSDTSASMTTRCHDQSMPDKGNFAAVVTAYRWQNQKDGLVADDVVGLRASTGSSGFHEMNQPVVAFTIDMQACKGNANVGDGSVSPTLCKPSGNDCHAVAIGVDVYNGIETGDVAATVTTQSGTSSGSGPKVVSVCGDTTHALTSEGADASEDGTGRGTPVVAHAFYSTGGTHGLEATPELSPPLKVGSALGIPSPPAVAFSCKDHGADASAVAPTLRAMPHSGSHANGGGQVAVAFAQNQVGEIRTSETMSTIGTTGNASARTTPKIMSGMVVRRLTPVECERLQGFPDGWTDVGTPEKPTADSHRYKQLGNAVTVNVAEWLAHRVASVLTSQQ